MNEVCGGEEHGCVLKVFAMKALVNFLGARVHGIPQAVSANP
jgi:hypothetical protein